MTRTLLKNTFREIKNTKARFVSIMAIIALGAGFFSGIKSTVPSMNRLAEDYYQSQSLMDFRLVSTVGFDEDDISAVSDAEGVSNVMPSYFADAVINEQSGGAVVHISASPKAYGESKELNSLVVTEGRLPEDENEIAVEGSGINGEKYKIGDTVTFEKKAGDTDLSEQLKTLEFTVVGKVDSPVYISYERGSAAIGNGKVSEFMYVSDKAFDIDRYTELYVRADFSEELSPFSKEYESSVEDGAALLEAVADGRCRDFDENVIQKAKNEVKDAQSRLDSEKEKTYGELEDAAAEIESSQSTLESEIASAREQLAAAKAELDSGYSEYEASLKTFQAEMDGAQKEIEENEEKLNASAEQYNSAKEEFDREISDAQEQIDASFSEYNASYEEFKAVTEPQLLEGIEQAQSAVDEITQNMQLVTDEKTLEILNLRLLAAQEQLDSLNLTYAEAQAQLDSAKEQLDSAKAQLDEKKAQGERELAEAYDRLQSGTAALEAAKEQLEAKRAEAQAQLASAKTRLDNGQSEYDTSAKLIEEQEQSGQKQLEEAKKEYDEGKRKADSQFEEVQKEIDDALSQANELTTPEWYVFTRDDNPGYSAFTSNTQRLDAVATVFPLFFLLVAVLVCVTTMTRLIEEKRTEIGTLKALGYGNASIVMKFIIYSVTASALGCAVGVTAGVLTLPYIIYNAYKMMYYMGDITVYPNTESIIISCAAALVCSIVVSAAVCARSLRRSPAQSMRPKAPKPGKRIMLEYIKPLWSHLSFTHKLTARNLFRYKTRMLMTVIGIAGCTALIVAAFGLLNSFDPLTRVQYEEIFKYDAAVIPDGSQSDGENRELAEQISQSKNVKSAALAAQLEAQAEFDGRTKDSDTYIVIADDPQSLDEVITLRTRTEKESLSLDDSSVILNEKLAFELGIEVGDTIKLKTDSLGTEVRVGGINEHYTHNYIYMTPGLYESLFGEEPQYNMILTVLDDDGNAAQNEFGSALLNDDRVAAVSFVSTGVDEFERMLGSLNMVVAVMIICAAALAFVVLYNLTNINIAERVREIATFKVLGFYNRETASMIYRENTVLTCFGIAAGLVLGLFLTRFIVQTVEVDNVMFGRDIYFTSYLFAALLTLLFSLLVNLAMVFKLKTINMVESLKSIE